MITEFHSHITIPEKTEWSLTHKIALVFLEFTELSDVGYQQYQAILIHIHQSAVSSCKHVCCHLNDYWLGQSRMEWLAYFLILIVFPICSVINATQITQHSSVGNKWNLCEKGDLGMCLSVFQAAQLCNNNVCVCVCLWEMGSLVLWETKKPSRCWTALWSLSD